MQIRTFQSSDQKAAQGIILEGLKEHWGFIDDTLNPDVYDIEKAYMKDGSTFVVIEHDGKIVGTGGLIATDKSDTVQMVRVSVHTEHRRKGIAKQIVAELLKIAKEMGYKKILVETTKTWTAPRTLYNSIGFTEIYETEEDVYMLKDLG
jgi:N-acetylglutamate synthase-like GNAT family acetyltransferase